MKVCENNIHGRKGRGGTEEGWCGSCKPLGLAGPLQKSAGEWLLKLLTRWPGDLKWPVGPSRSGHMNCTGNRKCTREMEFQNRLFIYMFRTPYEVSLRRYRKSPYFTCSWRHLLAYCICTSFTSEMSSSKNFVFFLLFRLSKSNILTYIFKISKILKQFS